MGDEMKKQSKWIIITALIMALLLSVGCSELRPMEPETVPSFSFDASPNQNSQASSSSESSEAPAENSESASEESSSESAVETPASESVEESSESESSEANVASESSAKAETSETTEDKPTAAIKIQSTLNTEGQNEEWAKARSRLFPFPDSGLQVPHYLQTGDETELSEPPVPSSLPSEKSIRGIGGHRVERFFKTLSNDPVFYHYVVYPGEDDAKAKGDSGKVSEVLIVINKDQRFMRIDSAISSVAILQLEADYYYQIDLLTGDYEKLRVSDTFNSELSLEAFRKLEKDASKFIRTGSGNAIFYGQRVTFDEYTADGKVFTRYYFVGDALVGHRSFENGKLQRSVRVAEASNRLVTDYFRLPGGLRDVVSGASTTDPVESESETDLLSLEDIENSESQEESEIDPAAEGDLGLEGDLALEEQDAAWGGEEIATDEYGNVIKP